MTQTAKIFATPAGVALCPFEDLADGTARNFVLQMRAGRFHGFVVRKGETAHGFVDQCPHAGVPLARSFDDYLTPDGQMIACSWHGALFRIEDGECVGGPCVGQRLREWPIIIDSGWVKTGAMLAE